MVGNVKWPSVIWLESVQGSKKIMHNDFGESIKGYMNPVRIEDNQEQQREL
jgi:hypothetical protein